MSAMSSDEGNLWFLGKAALLMTWDHLQNCYLNSGQFGCFVYGGEDMSILPSLFWGFYRDFLELTFIDDGD